MLWQDEFKTRLLLPVTVLEACPFFSAEQCRQNHLRVYFGSSALASQPD